MFKSFWSLAALIFVASYVQPLSAQAHLIAAPSDRIIQPIRNTELVTLKRNILPLTQTAIDRGPAAASTPTGPMFLILKRSSEQERALRQYLDDLQNQASPSFHKWLTPQQYGANFGISNNDLASVNAWLQSEGFKIENVPQARNLVQFSGTFAQVQNAFHTSIHAFSTTNGASHFANLADPQIPAALAPVVAAVGPLNDFHPKPVLVRGPNGRYDPSTGSIIPDLTLRNGTAYYLFVDPADAAIIYNTPNSTLNPNHAGSSYDGAGVSIGIVGVSDLTSADVANYRMAFLGETSGSVNLPTVIVDGNDPGLNGGGTEALLDTEIAGGLAPKAKIYYYTSADSDLASGLFNAIFRAINDNTVSILNASFSVCEADLGASGNQVVLEAGEQAAAQGITFTVSSGDNGSAGCDNFNTQTQASLGFAVNGLASTPYVTAVGGTDFDTLATSFSSYVNNATSGTAPYYATALKYIPENPWNDSTKVNTTYSNNTRYLNSQAQGNIIAGSGGVSSVYAKPSFQTSLTPQDGFRDLPDVSFLAGNGLYNAGWVLCSDNVTDGVTTQGYTECQTTNGQFSSSTVFGGVGGTSASAPAFAGMLALVAQAHGSAADNYRLGQVDNVLYQLAQSKYSTVFHDVTTGNNSVPCATSSPNCGSNGFLTGYNAGTKYDLASGLGSVDVSALVSNWATVPRGSTNTTLTINGSTAAYTGVHGQSINFSVNVSPTSATGTVGIVDSANQVSGGPLNDGQFAIPISGGAGNTAYNGLPGGSYSVWARYSGDNANASSTSSPSIDVTITPENSATALSVQAYDTAGNPISNTGIPFGSYVFADAQIAGAAEGNATRGLATGTVSFTDGAATLGSANVTSNNQATWPSFSNPKYLTGGTHQLVAHYGGDASYNPSASSPVTITVVPVSTFSQPQATSYTINSTQSTSVNIYIYSNYVAGIPPTGSASVSLNNTVIATTSSLDSVETGTTSNYQWETFGYITVKASQLQAGLNNLTVAYSGDSNYAPSNATLTIDAIAPGGGVNLTTPSSLTLGANAKGPFTATMTLTASGGYTGWFNWGCYLTPSVASVDCWIPEGHAALSSPADIPLIISGSAPAGAYTLTINGSDNESDGVDIAQSVPVTFNASPVPGIAVLNNEPLIVSPGANTANVSNLSVFSSDGFSGVVNLTCSVTTSLSSPQDLPTCSVPDSVTLDGAIPAVAQVSVSTNASTTTGKYSVAITATSASDNSITTTGVVPLTITASPSYSITSNGLIRSPVAATNAQAATLTITPVNGYSGTVQLSCFATSAFTGYGFILPTCTVPSSVQVSSGSPTTVDVSLHTDKTTEIGPYLMTITSVDPASQLGVDSTINLMVTSAPSFSLSSSGSISVSAGSTSGNSSTINVTPTDGFTGSVNLTCSVSTGIVSAKNIPTCSLSPAAVNVTGTSAVTSTLTVTTTGSTSGAVEPVTNPFGRGATMPFLACALLFGMRFKRRKWLRLLSSLLLVAWIGTVGCGGGGSGNGSGSGGSSGTTPGNYSIIVKAKDAATGTVSAQTIVTVTVK